MRASTQKIMMMAGDQRISDKNFRWAMLQINRTQFQRQMLKDILDELWTEAIEATERDEHTH